MATATRPRPPSSALTRALRATAALLAVCALHPATLHAADAEPAAAAAAPSAAAPGPAAPIAIRALPASVGEVPVMHQGRVKPLVVAAEETLYAIAAKGSYEQVLGGVPQRSDAVSTVMAWMEAPAAWQRQPILYNPFLALQKAMQLDRQYAAINEVHKGPGSILIMGAVAKHQEADESKERTSYSALENAALTLASRTVEASEALRGDAIALLPLAPDEGGRAWAIATLLPALGDAAPQEAVWRTKLRDACAGSPGDAPKRLAEANIWLTIGDLRADEPRLTPAADPSLSAAVTASRAWLDAVASGDAAAIARTQAPLVAALRAQGARAEARGESTAYPSPWQLAVELAYARIHPFTWSWLTYILGAALCAGGLARRGQGIGPARAWLGRIGIALIVAGIIFNLYGLGSRVAITSLGAVTNLFETLVYVSLLCAVFSLALLKITGNRLYAVVGGIGAAVCASVGEAIPPDLGAHIGQLKPVLRSKFWLWTHVKTEVASYAAFTLAWVMGNVVLARAWYERERVRPEEAKAIYRCIQVGVVLVAAGTLLGAWWADYAWGRFWGWDPKEDCALLILLTYLVPLHLRYIGVVGPTGLAAWSVFGFFSVMMSWYGVNFLLQAGMHAYAFGNGGQAWVLSLCAAQIVLTTLMLIGIKRRARLSDDVAAERSAAAAKEVQPAPAPRGALGGGLGQASPR